MWLSNDSACDLRFGDLARHSRCCLSNLCAYRFSAFGNELLGRIRGYVDETRYYHQSGHTVARVFGVLRDPRIQPPASWQPAEGISSAGGIFVGYLMLDALIGNTDRHRENWGLVVRASGAQPDVRLAPTFDHASSLGRNETDARRQVRLVSKDPSFSIRSYAERARSALYKLASDHRPLLTFDAFKEAVRIYPQAGRLWMRRLKEVEDDQLRFILKAIPPDFMTPVAREFALRLLLTSKERIISFADALP